MTAGNPAGALPSLADIPHLPRDGDAEIVFSSPWEAKAFAIVLQLYQRGHFTWPEWAEHLGAEISAAGSSDDGSGYYLLWLSAAEKLLTGKALCAGTELARRKQALETSQGGPAPA